MPLPINSCGNRGKPRLEDHFAILRVPLPVAEVLDEATRVLGTAGDLRARTRLREVGIDTRRQLRYLCRRKHIAHHNRAVSGESIRLFTHGWNAPYLRTWQIGLCCMSG